MKNQVLIDSHAHVQFPAYDEDREAVIRRALDEGVGVINVGTQYSTSADALKLAEKYENGVWATVGFHPGHAGENSHHDPWESREQNQESFDIEKLRELARKTKAVAVGECGLDYFRLKSEDLGFKDKQKEVFEKQIELAIELEKPLALHCRPTKGTQDAYDDLYDILKPYIANRKSGLRGVVHFFAGSKETAKKLLDLGFYISFAGPITFAAEYEEVVGYVPLNKTLAETDSPYVAPAPYRGKRNEPVYVAEVAKKIAQIKAIAYDEVARRLTKNTADLFGLELLS